MGTRLSMTQEQARAQVLLGLPSLASRLLTKSLNADAFASARTERADAPRRYRVFEPLLVATRAFRVGCSSGHGSWLHGYEAERDDALPLGLLDYRMARTWTERATARAKRNASYQAPVIGAFTGASAREKLL